MSPAKMPGMENFNPLRDAIPVGEIRRALVIPREVPPQRDRDTVYRFPGDCLFQSFAFAEHSCLNPELPRYA